MTIAQARAALAASARWRPVEFLFWLAVVAVWFLAPSYSLLLNEIAIAGLFALSLDLILGYAGIVSLGHAAFFGLGAYSAGLVGKIGLVEPASGLLVAGAVAASVGFATSFLVLRGSDLTRLMVTLSVSLVLGEIANRWVWLTGGSDGLQGMVLGPLLGRFEFDMFGRVGAAYSLVVLFTLFLLARTLVHSPFGLSVRAIAGNPLRSAAIGLQVGRRLIGIYTIGACYAGVAGALLAQTTQFVSLDVLAFHRSAEVMLILVIGGTGYLYGGLIGAILFKLLQDGLSGLTPQYWQFWLGIIFVALVVIGRDRVFGWPASLIRRLR